MVRVRGDRSPEKKVKRRAGYKERIRETERQTQGRRGERREIEAAESKTEVGRESGKVRNKESKNERKRGQGEL